MIRSEKKRRRGEEAAWFMANGGAGSVNPGHSTCFLH